MSSRPTSVKRANRVRKAFRATPPAYFSVIQWLQDHGHANSRGEARALVDTKRVKVDSHVVSSAHIPVEHRDGITVVSEA